MIPTRHTANLTVARDTEGEDAMKLYVCSICGYVYDEAKGAPGTGTPAGTHWADLAESWVCPLCGAAKAEFHLMGEVEPTVKEGEPGTTASTGSLTALAALEMSAVCSNLARGCEKQYLAQEAGWYRELEAFFKASAAASDGASFDALLTLAQNDLDNGIPAAQATSKTEKDRGAQRALVWDDKVTRIHKSLLARYQREGEAMLEGVNAYVCSACGFIFLGAEPPTLCPVCKVPAWKFDRVEGRVQA